MHNQYMKQFIALGTKRKTSRRRAAYIAHTALDAPCTAARRDDIRLSSCCTTLLSMMHDPPHVERHATIPRNLSQDITVTILF